jgi:hypothetical protein
MCASRVCHPPAAPGESCTGLAVADLCLVRCCCPFTVNIRRSIYSILLSISVLASAVLVGAITPWLAPLAFSSGFVAIALLCIWCAVYVRDEPLLVRIALIWVALLSFSVIIAVFMAPPLR